MSGSEAETAIRKRDLEACRSPGTDLSRKSTIGVGVTTDLFFEPETLDELHRLRQLSDELDRDVFVIGGGSNLLFTSRARELILVELSGERFTCFEMSRKDDLFRIDTGAGQPLPPLVRHAVQNDWYTFGRLTGIPGTVGGAIYGNSGTREGEIGDFVSDVYILHPNRPEEHQLENPEFRYRWSSTQDELVLRVVLEGKNDPEDRENPPHERIQNNRQKTQPISERSAGCMFKNPENLSAGRLIDDAGLKGHRVGDAYVSQKHANFIVNDGEATPEEVINLIQDIQKKIQSSYGINLETEIQII